ncbi:hypothetical protein SAMCCGM7_pB0147 (plasmid) [Sinorhizobium americanum CCGM7]|nr:hypothetical protein SAMCCGM7_pB0147 [Sinorhizobium americanum CCGM7]
MTGRLASSWDGKPQKHAAGDKSDANNLPGAKFISEKS